ALSAEFTIGEGELMAHDVPLGCAPDEYDDLISGTCSHLPYHYPFFTHKYYRVEIKGKSKVIISGRYNALHLLCVEENPFLF
ncbi:hypothetical protein ACB368_27420, partial [Escherichia coli]